MDTQHEIHNLEQQADDLSDTLSKLSTMSQAIAVAGSIMFHDRNLPGVPAGKIMDLRRGVTDPLPELNELIQATYQKIVTLRDLTDSLKGKEVPSGLEDAPAFNSL